MNPRYFTTRDICALTGRSRSSIDRDVAAGLLPSPVKFGRRNFWIKQEVMNALQVIEMNRRRVSNSSVDGIGIETCN